MSVTFLLAAGWRRCSPRHAHLYNGIRILRGVGLGWRELAANQNHRPVLAGGDDVHTCVPGFLVPDRSTDDRQELLVRQALAQQVTQRHLRRPKQAHLMNMNTHKKHTRGGGLGPIAPRLARPKLTKGGPPHPAPPISKALPCPSKLQQCVAKDFTLKLPSAVRRTRLHESQKCSVMEVMKPMRPGAPGTWYA